MIFLPFTKGRKIASEYHLEAELSLSTCLPTTAQRHWATWERGTATCWVASPHGETAQGGAADQLVVKGVAGGEPLLCGEVEERLVGEGVGVWKGLLVPLLSSQQVS